MATYRVLRHFRSGKMLKPGDTVDGTSLRNLQALVDQRYLVAADADGTASNLGGPTPDPKIAQDREIEREAGRQVGPSDDVAGDDKVLGRAGEGAEGGATKVTEEEGKKLRGALPEDFPGHGPLVAEGLDTYAKVRKNLDTIEDVKGIAEKLGDKIRAAFGVAPKFATDESEVVDQGGTSEASVGAEGAEGGPGSEEPGDSTVPKAPNV